MSGASTQCPGVQQVSALDIEEHLHDIYRC